MVQKPATTSIIVFNLITLFVLGLLLASCVTKPIKTNFEKSRHYSQPKDEIWTSLVRFLSTYSVQIKTIEKESGIIYAEPTTSDQVFSDCGSSALVAVRSRPTSVNIFVSEERNGTTVTVNTKFSEIRSLDTSVWTVDCYSTGLLERTILDALNKTAE